MSKACAAYQEKYSKIPKDAATLIAFSKKTKGIKEPSENSAKKAIAAARKAKEEEEAAAAAAAEAKKGKKKGKKGKKSKEKEESSEEEAPPPAKKKEKKEKVSTKYQIGDSLLLSKDRMGTLRYAGEIPELGPGIWYGVELTDGSVGQTSGSVKGKTYFECKDGLKRALFVPLFKIRRKMNTRDHSRQESLSSLQQLAKKVVRRESQSDSKGGDDENDGVDSDEKTGKVTPAENDDDGDDDPAPEEDDDDEENESEEEVPQKSSSSKRRGSVIKPTSGGFQSILQFILDQKVDIREEFLDIYTNPSLNPLFTEAFKQIKDMDPDKQSDVWRMLVTRWKRYLK